MKHLKTTILKVSLVTLLFVASFQSLVHAESLAKIKNQIIATVDSHIPANLKSENVKTQISEYEDTSTLLVSVFSNESLSDEVALPIVNEILCDLVSKGLQTYLDGITFTCQSKDFKYCKIMHCKTNEIDTSNFLNSFSYIETMKPDGTVDVFKR